MKNAIAMGLLIFSVLPGTGGADSLAGLGDPTRPSGSTGGSNYGGLVLESTLVATHRKLAVINGQRLGVGERIRDAEVVAIRPYEVVIRQKGKERILRLIPKLAIEAQRDDAGHAATNEEFHGAQE